MNDGASALVLANKEIAREFGTGGRALARIVSTADAAIDPVDFPVAPAKAVPIALERAGITKDQVAVWEFNEAFAAVIKANEKVSLILAGLEISFGNSSCSCRSWLMYISYRSSVSRMPRWTCSVVPFPWAMLSEALAPVSSSLCFTSCSQASTVWQPSATAEVLPVPWSCRSWIAWTNLSAMYNVLMIPFITSAHIWTWNGMYINYYE